MVSINSELSDAETENISYLPGQRPRSRGHARRVFGLKNRALRHAHARFNPYDYEQKYPEDPHGEEIGVNARVWWTYLDVAEEYDSERMENWKDTIDVLLIFAGLFSAIVTSFAVQSWQDSQPDYGEMTVSLLSQLFALQAAVASGSPIPELQAPAQSQNTTSTRVVHALWFTSLSLSLSTALIAMTTKQWLQHYISAIPGLPRERCTTRQFRFMGLETWRVAFIIGLLPFIMHIALALFLIGLVLFLRELDLVVVSLTAGLAGSTFFFYFLSFLLPIYNVQCPYQTPVTIYLYAHFIPRLRRFRSFIFNGIFRIFQLNANDFPARMKQWLQTTDERMTFRAAELKVVRQNSSQLEVSAILWMLDSPDISAGQIALESLAGLQTFHVPFLPGAVPKQASDLLYYTLERVKQGILDTHVERLARADLLNPHSIFTDVLDASLPSQGPLTPGASDEEIIIDKINIVGIINRAIGRTKEKYRLDLPSIALSFLTGPGANRTQHAHVWMRLFNALPFQRELDVVAPLVDILVKANWFTGKRDHRVVETETSTTMSRALEANSISVFNHLCKVFGCDSPVQLNFFTRVPPRSQIPLLRAILQWTLDQSVRRIQNKTEDFTDVGCMLNSVMRCGVLSSADSRLKELSPVDAPMPWENLRSRFMGVLESDMFSDEGMSWHTRRGILTQISAEWLGDRALENVLQQLCSSNWDDKDYVQFAFTVLYYLSRHGMLQTNPSVKETLLKLDILGGVALSLAPHFRRRSEWSADITERYQLGLVRALKPFLDLCLEPPWSEYIQRRENVLLITELLIATRQEDNLRSFARKLYANPSWPSIVKELITNIEELHRLTQGSETLGLSTIRFVEHQLEALKDELHLDSAEYVLPEKWVPFKSDSRPLQPSPSSPELLSNANMFESIEYPGAGPSTSGQRRPLPPWGMGGQTDYVALQMETTTAVDPTTPQKTA